MVNYELTLEITEKDLRVVLQGGQQVVIARAFSDAPSNVAWITITPVETNVVSWTDSYGIYASNKVGDISVEVSTKAGIPSGTYFTLTEEGLVGPSTGPDAPEPGAFRAINRMDDLASITLGMGQGAGTAGVLSPINASLVPANQMATWTPVPAVYVWLASGIVAGTTVTVPPPAGASVPPPAGASGVRTVSSWSTRIDFEQGGSARCRYDPSIGAFVEQPSSA